MGSSSPSCLHGGQEGKKTPAELRDSVWHYGKLPQDQHKLGMNRQALLFSCRKEGLFHPMGKVLDKSKLMIYWCCSLLFADLWAGMGWCCPG